MIDFEFEPESHKWFSGFLYPFFLFSGSTDHIESFSSINFLQSYLRIPEKSRVYKLSSIGH